jgi:hypothetical protein
MEKILRFAQDDKETFRFARDDKETFRCAEDYVKFKALLFEHFLRIWSQ